MMNAAKVEVSVFDGAELIQTWPCTRAVMPDGSPGVIWRGMLYALLPDDRIDIGAVPAAAAPGFTVLSGEAASWVLIQGPPASLKAAETALAAGGIVVARSGRWLGEPVAGMSFDWYLRAEGPLDTDTIGALLGAPPALTSEAADPLTRAFILEQQVSALLADVARLKREAAEHTATVVSAPAVPAPATFDVANDLIAELAVKNHQLDEMQAQFDALRANQGAITGEALNLHDELASVLERFRPDIDLIRHSLRVAVGEFGERSGFYRALADLPVSGARPDGWKKLRGADRWWERHVSNGQDDTGRAYARFDTARKKWMVLLGWKKEQTRDIAWLEKI